MCDSGFDCTSDDYLCTEKIIKVAPPQTLFQKLIHPTLCNNVHLIYKTKKGQRVSSGVLMKNTNKCNIYFNKGTDDYHYFYINLFSPMNISNGKVIANHVTIGPKNGTFFIHNTEYSKTPDDLLKKKVCWYSINEVNKIIQQENCKSTAVEKIWDKLNCSLTGGMGGNETPEPKRQRTGDFFNTPGAPMRDTQTFALINSNIGENKEQFYERCPNGSFICWRDETGSGSGYAIADAFDANEDEYLLKLLPEMSGGAHKILNPKTGRYVNANGRIGKQILLQRPKSKGKNNK